MVQRKDLDVFASSHRRNGKALVNVVVFLLQREEEHSHSEDKQDPQFCLSIQRKLICGKIETEKAKVNDPSGQKGPI